MKYETSDTIILVNIAYNVTQLKLTQRKWGLRRDGLTRINPTAHKVTLQIPNYFARPRSLYPSSYVISCELHFCCWILSWALPALGLYTFHVTYLFSSRLYSDKFLIFNFNLRKQGLDHKKESRFIKDCSVLRWEVYRGCNERFFKVYYERNTRDKRNREVIKETEWVIVH